MIDASTNYNSNTQYSDASASNQAGYAVQFKCNNGIKSTIPVGYIASIREKTGSNIMFSSELLGGFKVLYDYVYLK